jgi:hypothetical protein
MFGEFRDLSFLLHITQFEGRTVERLLAPAEAGASSASLGGAVVEAAYVATDPPLLARLTEERVPWIVDPQSVRFSSPGYLQTARLRALSYAPALPLDPARFTAATDRMVRSAMEFQAEAEPSMYSVPALPLVRPSAAVFRTFTRIHELAADLNGRDVPFRPLISTVYPSAAVVRGRFSVFERLLDGPFAGAYVLPLAFNPKRDSVERLVGYVRFLEYAQSLKLRVVAGRAGAFGLLLAAFGIENFDSGLGERESFNLTRLTKERPPRQPGEKGDGGRQTRVYLAPLRSSVSGAEAERVLETPALRAQMACGLGSCRFGGYRYALENHREHFFHTRADELAQLAARRSPELRVQLVLQWLRAAADTGRMVNGVLTDGGGKPIGLEHLDTWRAVLTRVGAAVAVRVR